MRRAVTAAAVLLSAATAAAQEAPGSRVIVMPFSVQASVASPGGAGAAFWLGEATAILLTEELQNLGVGVLSRDERLAAADRLQLPIASTLTRATMIRVGELVGASEIVFGEARLTGDRLSVRARRMRPGTGVQLSDLTDEAPLAEIFPLFERLARSVARDMGRPLSPRATTAPRPSLETFENYVKGLVAVTPAAQQRFLEAAYRQAPRDSRVLVALWSVYGEQGSHEKALAVARNVPTDSPLFRKARFDAALSLIELKRFDEAFRELTTLNGERAAPVLSSALGVVQLRRGGTPANGSAAYYFHQSVEAAPEDTDALFNLGYAYALAHDAQAALFWLREAVRFDATNGDAHLVMSAVLASAGRSVEAQRELELAKLLGTRRDVSASTLSDKIPAGLERLPANLDTLQLPRFEAIGSPAQREQQEVAAFHLSQGRRLIEENKDREAVNELRRAIYLSPYQDEPHRLLGRLYQRTGRLSDAIDEFKVAIWCRESVEARVALGTALLETGDKSAARREAERALALNPNDLSARELMKRIGGQP